MNPAFRSLKIIARLIALVFFLIASLFSSYADEVRTNEESVVPSASDARTSVITTSDFGL